MFAQLLFQIVKDRWRSGIGAHISDPNAQPYIVGETRRSVNRTQEQNLRVDACSWTTRQVSPAGLCHPDEIRVIPA